MDDALLIGIDIGSSSAKGILVDKSGAILAERQINHSFSRPRPGWAEQDPDTSWWPETVEIIRGCVQDAGADPARVVGIGVTGMVPNLTPVDAEGRCCRPAILYRDNRALAQCDALNEKFGQKFNTQDMLPKWLWVKENEPETCAKIRWVLNTHSYLIYKLTGQANIDCDCATLFGGQVYDEKAMAWRPGWVEKFGLDAAALPPIYRQNEVVGCLTPDVAKRCGLTTATRVCGCNGDSLMSMLGAGVTRAGDAMLYLGTAATLLALDAPAEDLLDGLAVNSGHIHFMGNVLAGAESFVWYKETLQLGHGLSYRQLDEAAQAVPAGSEGLLVLPHFNGQRTPVYDPLAAGSFLGLSTGHTDIHLFRAVMEGIAYAMKESIEGREGMIKRLITCGGAAKSPIFKQILADVLDMPLHHSPASGAGLGVAYYTGLSLGVFRDYAPLRDTWLRGITTIHPQPENQKVYAAGYALYKQAGPALRALYPGLKALG